MASKGTKVIVGTRTTGVHFGTIGVIRSAKTGRIIREANTIRPYGFPRAALDDAKQMANDYGYDWTEAES